MLSILEQPRGDQVSSAATGNSRCSCVVELPCPTKDDGQTESGQQQTSPDQDKPASHQNDVTPAKGAKKAKETGKGFRTLEGAKQQMKKMKY